MIILIELRIYDCCHTCFYKKLGFEYEITNKKVTWKFGGGIGGGMTGIIKGGSGMNGGWRPAMDGLPAPGKAPAPISGVCPGNIMKIDVSYVNKS